MVSLHMISLICALHKDTANSSDRVVASGWFVSGDWNGDKCNGYNALTARTVIRLSSSDWLRTISMMGRYPADCRTKQYHSDCEQRHGLKRSDRLHVLNCSVIWRFLYFRSSLGEVSFICIKKLRHGIIVYRRFMTIWWFAIRSNSSHITEYPNILNMCLKIWISVFSKHILPDLLV